MTVRDKSVYAALNQCHFTGLERTHSVEIMPNGHVIRTYLDNFLQWRLVVFKSKAHRVGYAGVIVDASGHIRRSEVANAMRADSPIQALIWYGVGKGLQIRDGMC